MVVLLGAAALAIDLGRAYGVKAKLNAAVDAASFEAAKALAQGSGESGMKAHADLMGTKYFNANYPGEFLGATPSAPKVAATRDKNGGWRVNVSATARMPTFFAGLLGWKTFDITAASEAVRATLDLVLVLDTSSSMYAVFPEVRDRAKEFVKLFDRLDDRMGLVAFSTGAYPIVSICGAYPNTVQNPAADSLSCGRGFVQERVNQAIGYLNSGGMTASEEGMKKALDQLNALRSSERSGKRVIVFFSDGAPNTLNGRFPLNGGGSVDGNLFSYVFFENSPQLVYNPSRYYDAGTDYGMGIASLPTHDLSGTIPLASYNNKRAFTGNPNPPYVKCDANIAARNMTENVADLARKEGITVYSIGFGEIDSRQMFDPRCSTTYNEIGSDILKRLANSKDSDSYNPNQPTGMYCPAPDTDALKLCFDKVASAILRITK
ncbi:MAG: hypothetical protein A2075_00970 [Geobacteraceae bacterium GWC2_58_44]|nr:MAG: hypothetical protein A2075_00970 [Geobacteraceae bacterium GWC2_58_44]